MKKALLALTLLTLAGTLVVKLRAPKMGPQPDGGFIVATGKRIEPGTIAFDGRPIDIALHPSSNFLAVLNQKSVLLVRSAGVIENSDAKLAAGASFRGCCWQPDGNALYVSVSPGYVQQFTLVGQRLQEGKRIDLKDSASKMKAIPGGMCISKDGKKLFVTDADGGCVVEVNLDTYAVTKRWKVQNIPFDVRLSEDERFLIVSNWGGREAEKENETADSGGVAVIVDKRGIASTGTVSIIDLQTQNRTDIAVGRHPAGLAVSGDKAYVANAASDTISEISIPLRKVTRTFVIMWKGRDLFGSMPNAIAVLGNRLYACDGGDNAISEIDLGTGKCLGFRPAGFFPVGICVDGNTAYVVNTKGNGSVRETVKNKPGNAHNFQGTVSILSLDANINEATAKVAELNEWNVSRSTNLAVYKGAIKHVLYIIKENRTYDEVFGDMPQGNGDPKLCGLGEEVTPNHHALASEFTLFDNAYVSGTNSAEGHQWAVEGLANDYIERFYPAYTRSYPYDGGDAMAYADSGFIWDAAAKKGKSIRVYGEFCKEELSTISPKPKDWLEVWSDRQAGGNKFKVTAGTSVAGLRKYIHPRVICWPTIMSDQWRADEFIKEYNEYSAQDRVPNLMLLTLPSDHTEGTNPGYPKPKSMVADNDLALGRVVEAISKSPQWKDTCIFVMEDDAQAGPDHVDGHRTVCLAISPYTKRKFVDSSMYTQISIVRSIELMLGLDPMNKFDATAAPFFACFTDKPDSTPYLARPNKTPLGDMNPPIKKLSGKQLYWAKKSLSLDWSDIDSADWYWLNRIVWHSLHNTPYPEDR